MRIALKGIPKINQERNWLDDIDTVHVHMGDDGMYINIKVICPVDRWDHGKELMEAKKGEKEVSFFVDFNSYKGLVIFAHPEMTRLKAFGTLSSQTEYFLSSIGRLADIYIRQYTVEKTLLGKEIRAEDVMGIMDSPDFDLLPDEVLNRIKDVITEQVYVLKMELFVGKENEEAINSVLPKAV